MVVKLYCQKSRLFIALLLLFSITTPTSGQQDDPPAPPPPPTWAEAAAYIAEAYLPDDGDSEALARSGDVSVTSAGACKKRYCEYVPSLTNGTASSKRSSGTRTRAEALAIYRGLYLASKNIAHGWTGSVSGCRAGATSSAFIAAMLKRINYFRQMAGLANLQRLDSAYNRKSQAAALMMSANNALSHSPPTSWKCYSAEGAQAAGSSNLFLGMFGAEAIDGYIRDPGGGNTAGGHRRWILLPQTTAMGAGDIPNGSQMAGNSLWVFDSSIGRSRPATRYPYVAWPPPGYIPYNTVYPRWSFAIKDADFSQSTVRVTRGSAALAITMYPPVNGYGENTLLWQVNGMGDWDTWPRPAADATYTVQIKRVRANGAYRDFSYTVTVFDPAK